MNCVVGDAMDLTLQRWTLIILRVADVLIILLTVQTLRETLEGQAKRRWPQSLACFARNDQDFYAPELQLHMFTFFYYMSCTCQLWGADHTIHTACVSALDNLLQYICQK